MSKRPIFLSTPRRRSRTAWLLSIKVRETAKVLSKSLWKELSISSIRISKSSRNSDFLWYRRSKTQRIPRKIKANSKKLQGFLKGMRMRWTRKEISRIIRIITSRKPIISRICRRNRKWNLEKWSLCSLKRILARRLSKKSSRKSARAR